MYEFAGVKRCLVWSSREAARVASCSSFGVSSLDSNLVGYVSSKVEGGPFRGKYSVKVMQGQGYSNGLDGHLSFSYLFKLNGYLNWLNGD